MGNEHIVKEIYSARFAADYQSRENVWKVLTRHFFQRLIGENKVVLEVAAGYCHFINNISAKEKIAVDINEDTKKYAQPDVRVIIGRSENLSELEESSVDSIFISNFFEHLERKVIIDTLLECKRVLVTGGSLIVLQPNYFYAYREYFNYFDHVTAIDHHSLSEVLELTGFKVEKIIPKFLPYSMKSRLPSWPFLVRVYLKIKIAQWFLGKQALAVAKKGKS